MSVDPKSLPAGSLAEVYRRAVFEAPEAKAAYLWLEDELAAKSQRPEILWPPPGGRVPVCTQGPVSVSGQLDWWAAGVDLDALFDTDDPRHARSIKMPGDDNRCLSRKLDDLIIRAARDFFGFLRSGALIANGIKEPINHEEDRADIPANLWSRPGVHVAIQSGRVYIEQDDAPRLMFSDIRVFLNEAARLDDIPKYLHDLARENCKEAVWRIAMEMEVPLEKARLPRGQMGEIASEIYEKVREDHNVNLVTVQRYLSWYRNESRRLAKRKPDK